MRESGGSPSVRIRIPVGGSEGVTGGGPPAEDVDGNPEEDEGELREEIAARLAVRRKFYRGSLAVVVLIVAGATVLWIWTQPGTWPYALVWASSGVLGTAAVLWWAYVVRESALYEAAGRHVLDRK